MSLLDHQPEQFVQTPSRAGRFLLMGLIVVGCLGAAYLFTTPADEPASTATAVDPPRTAVTPEPASEAPPPAVTPVPEEPEPEPEPEPAPERPAAAAPRVPESRLEPLLRVASDVPNASVFLDRQFLGTTPFETSAVSPGPHRLNVSAEGHEGFIQTIEFGDDPIAIDVRFLEVRLAASVPVVHKHRFGECEGVLRADLDGLHYDTTDDDTFSIPFREIEQHEIDYLEHTLTVKRRGGRTYNFTDEQDTADALFAFHREVERTRERLAAP